MVHLRSLRLLVGEEEGNASNHTKLSVLVEAELVRATLLLPLQLLLVHPPLH
jgi:hypothetical protein